MPEISIVLPTYNGASYIEQAINSIIKQTFEDWELIIVNDASTDNTMQIICKYMQCDSRIKVVNNSENKKLPASLNIGFKYSSGRFLTWTSDDNCYLPEALKIMYQYLCKNKEVYMVCADMNMIDDLNNVVNEFPHYDKTEIFYHNCVGACFMYKREVLEQIGEFDTKLFLVEDYDYWLRIIKQYNFIGHISQILYAYRIHNNSLTTKKQKEVNKKLICLRKKHFDLILTNLKYDKSYICKLFYDFLEVGERICDIEKKVVDIVPEIKIDKLIKEENLKFIIFGAGNYGGKAFEFLKNRVECFVDSDDSKVGKKKCGLDIISTKEMLKKHSDYNILIAVNNEKIFEILHFLYSNGLKKCCTYQKMIKKY